MDSRTRFRWILTGFAIALAVGAFCLWRFAGAQGGDSCSAGEPERQIWLEACRPIAIRQPLEVAGIAKSGEKGLYCAPGGGVATDDNGGEAVYRFFIPEAGRYRLWGYCCWLEEDSGGFVVTTGSDVPSPVLKSRPSGQWQWLPMAESTFSEGVGRLTLTARGRGFAVRRLFLCNNTSRHPLQSNTELKDIFHDDFDGCDDGEFDSWTKITGQWAVHHDEEDKSPASKILIGRSNSESIINVGDRKWQNYELMLDCRLIKASSGASVAVKFCYDDEGCGYMLRWTPAVRDRQVQMELLREAATGISVLDRFPVMWDTSRWSELSVEAWQDAIRINIDSRQVRTVEVTHSRGGSIGLWLQGDIEMMFDNIQVRGQRIREAPVERESARADDRDGEDQKETTTHDDDDI